VDTYTHMHTAVVVLYLLEMPHQTPLTTSQHLMYVLIMQGHNAKVRCCLPKR